MAAGTEHTLLDPGNGKQYIKGAPPVSNRLCRNCTQTFINTAGGPLNLARDFQGLQLAEEKVNQV